MSKIIKICSHIPSRNPIATKNFFQEVFKFNVLFEYEGYIELEKDGNLIGIMQSEGEPNQQSLYLRMEGLDSFWKENKDSLLKYDSGEPFVRDYGMKEIHIIAPETNTLIFVGENISE